MTYAPELLHGLLNPPPRVPATIPHEYYPDLWNPSGTRTWCLPEEMLDRRQIKCELYRACEEGFAVHVSPANSCIVFVPKLDRFRRP